MQAPRVALFLLASGVALTRASANRETFAQPATMVRIAGGVFVTGSDSSDLPALMQRYHTRHAELFAGEMPRRTVHVGTFWIDRTDVTKAQFREFIAANPAWRKTERPATSHNGRYLEDWTGTTFAEGEGLRPVVFVTWPAARAYCAFARKRLPTEAEWEFAARGGLRDPEFPWGDSAPDSTTANWSAANLGRPSNVGEFPPNGYGLYDMAGNVWQFVADSWAVDSTRLTASAAAEGPGTRHVIRGGSYEGAAVNLRVRYRDSHPGGGAGPHVGFRCARSA